MTKIEEKELLADNARLRDLVEKFQSGGKSDVPAGAVTRKTKAKAK
tara:strand:- start:3997 stop:4134 length:138 start_codon:yes stop_codon:yes gene_type:complete